ncbi:MAG: UpxY family transcription antiterminator [Candidatus Acidiferrales bacterium]
MSISQMFVEPAGATPLELTSWFAVHAVARHEKRVASQFMEKGITTFLPLLNQVHQWGDRRKKIQVPLFSCYVFVCIVPRHQARLDVLGTPGVLGFVGERGQGTSIPEEQVNNIRTIVAAAHPFGLHPFLRVGRRVRIRGGSLDGVEGILVGTNSDQSLIVSVDLLRRSLSIRVEGYDVEPVQ